MKIPFSRAPFFEEVYSTLKEIFDTGKLSGDHKYSLLCHKWFEENLPCKKALTTPSGTAALELSAFGIDLQPEEEVIMPSFTFTSTANAFLLRRAKIVFVDIRPDTLNINEAKLEEAITKKTKAIVVVHYAGVPCEMDTILEIAKKHNLYVIEDAAHSIRSTYKGKETGTLGDFGCFSFHDTKNLSCGEGGALILNKVEYEKKMEIIREKGTNRSQFFSGKVDKYTWHEIGSSFVMSDINACVLYHQLLHSEEITKDRLNTWNTYFQELKPLEDKGYLKLPTIPHHVSHNAHIFYILLNTHEERENLRKYLNSQGIGAVFHYIPLHSSPAGRKYTSFHGKDVYTTELSEKILRLPLFYKMNNLEIEYVIEKVKKYF